YTLLIGFTLEEVKEFFDAQRSRLDLLVMFELLATTEAILRLDFINRVEARKKDPLSRHFRRLKKATGEKIRLDEDILQAFKDHVSASSPIGNLRGVLRLRHWLAHGRHWHPKLGRIYTPGDVLDIAKPLVAAIPRWG